MVNISDVVRDVRHGLRLLVKHAGFSVVAVVTLAIGIGTTTAMFSVVNSTLLRPLPFKDPDRLVVVRERLPKLVSTPVSIEASDVVTYARENTSFDGVAGYLVQEFDLTGHDVPQRVAGTRVGWNLFSLLGVDPVMGRTFTATEDHPGSDVAIVSDRFWHQYLGGEAEPVGQTVSLDRRPYKIIGVMPASFVFPLRTDKPTDVWVPMGFTPDELKPGGTSYAYGALARLKPGVSLAEAQSDVGRIAKYIEQTLAAGRRGDLQILGDVVPLREDAFGDLRSALLALFAAVLLVLLIAVVNVANLMLVRGTARQRELAIRIAVGAGARRIVSQLLIEAVILGVVGGALGMLLAFAATSVLGAAVPPTLIRLDTVTVDGRVLMFVLGVSILAGLAFGTAPAAFALRANVSEKLKEGGRGTSVGPGLRRIRASFVVAQMALALMLLVGAGLLLRSFQRVLEVDPGFQPEHVMSARLSLSPTQYPDPAHENAFYKQLTTRLDAIPGAKAAGLANDLPLETQREGALTVDGYHAPPGAGLALTTFTFVMGDYFRTMGIPLMEGRSFTPVDDEKSQKTVIISRLLAKTYFAGRDPIGGRVKLGTAGGTAPWMTVVGVVGDVKPFGLDQQMLPHVYVPFLQRTPAQVHSAAVDLIMALRTVGEPDAAGALMRDAVWSLDREVPITAMRTMDQVISDSTTPRRFNLLLVGFFAGAALLLAAVGLHGVMSYSVLQRTHEIGVRMTLGARRRDVILMVLRSSVTLVLIGVAIGLTGALAAARLVTTFLFEVQPSDPVTFAVVALILTAVALVASMVPATRASNVDPLNALRNE